MTLTYSSIFAFLNAYCSPFPVFLKPPVGGEPGARSLPSLLAALIFYIIITLIILFYLAVIISIPLKNDIIITVIILFYLAVMTISVIMSSS